MALPVRKKLPHAIPSWVGFGSRFFITINCADRWRNHLCRGGIGDKILKAISHNHDGLVWYCRIALLMPDHLHSVFSFPPCRDMKKEVSNWKKFIARETGIQWQRDFFDHRIRNEEEYLLKMNYIRMNPVRRGLCERMEDWPWVYCPSDRS